MNNSVYFGFKDITIQYGKKKILENLSVEFPKGKLTTIIGKNGCGKSSLLKTVSKAVLPRQGEVIYAGKRLDRYSPKFLAQKIAYLAQVHTSPPTSTYVRSFPTEDILIRNSDAA